MARGRLFLILFVFAAIAVLAWWVTRMQFPPPSFLASPLRLTPVRFADVPDWSRNDPRDALSAFAHSCAALAKKQPTDAMGGAGYAGTVSDWRDACRALPSHANAAEARAFFESWATPVAIGNGDDRDGIFTGYYEPQIEASPTPNDVYNVPVYGTPDNLVSVNAGDFVDDLAGHHFTGCVEGHKLVKCPARADIDANGIKQAKILFYADDPIAVFFLHIQGSGRVHFTDGSWARVNYDSQNGQPYTAIGKTLIRMGVPRDGMSLQVIRTWLKGHPADAQRVMETDKSYVFFREEPISDPASGPIGSEGVALTAGTSLAVDMRLHPLGAPMFVAATRPDANPSRNDHPFNRLMVAQDSGGAIKNAVRGDVFWGFGVDSESIAGRMKAKGRLFVLLPKALAAKLGTSQDFKMP